MLGVLLLAGMVAAGAPGGSITVQRMTGEVSVRHGVTEVWSTVAAGDVLRPNDTMRTGRNGSATLLVGGSGGVRQLILPADVIVDISDVRDLTQEELMLKLAMQKVRATPAPLKPDAPQITDAAVVHGTDRGAVAGLAENDPLVGQSLLNGAKVLLENGFYATGVLRTLEVFRLFPALGGRVDNRLLLAGAMEKAELKGEAIAEYGALSRLTTLTAAQQAVVRGKLEALRSKN